MGVHSYVLAMSGPIECMGVDSYSSGGSSSTTDDLQTTITQAPDIGPASRMA